MNLNEAKLQQRAEELDARERFLDRREKLLSDSPITFKVYEERIKAYERQCDYLIADIRKYKTDQSHTAQGNSREVEVAQNKVEIINIAIQKSEAKVIEITKKIELKQSELQKLKEQIEERRVYLKEQEQIIETTIQEGNDRLFRLHDEVGDQEQLIQALEKQKMTLNKDYDNLVIKQTDVLDRIEKKIQILGVQKASFETEIGKLQLQITTEATRKQKIISEIDTKLIKLKEKEASLIAKQDALQLDKQEVAEQKRRLSSQEKLYTL